METRASGDGMTPRSRRPLRCEGSGRENLRSYDDEGPKDQRAPLITVALPRQHRLRLGLSNDTLDLVHAAKRCLEAGWKSDPDQARYGYTKAGVMVDDLVPEADRPRMLFDESAPRTARISRAMDAVNDRWGRKTVIVASGGFERAWRLRADHHSPRYTTRMIDLPTVR